MVAVSPSAMVVLSAIKDTVGNVESAGMVKFNIDELPVCTMPVLPESTSTETVKVSGVVSVVVSAWTSTVTSALVSPPIIVT